MTNFKSLFFILVLLQLSFAKADDLQVTVSGATIEDDNLVDKIETKEASAHVKDSENNLSIENLKVHSQSAAIPDQNTDAVDKSKNTNVFNSVGYSAPGSFEKEENYLETDKKDFANRLRKASTSNWNFTYFKDSFTYTSPNDIIARTISTGYKHVQAGYLLVRSDRYLFTSMLLNFHWSLGSGLSYNAGRGIFVDGVQSVSQFRLYEIPLDLGFGFEVPLYHWFKISATAGASTLGLIQNRSDLLSTEPNKNKMQIGYGPFGVAQFKISLTGFSNSWAHDIFINSQISNLLLTLDMRYQNYSHFKDAITISGTSVGAGVSFEFL
jgi:hypothetical protein